MIVSTKSSNSFKMLPLRVGTLQCPTLKISVDATESPVTETDNGNENGDENTDAPEPTTSTSETETPLDGDQTIPENILDDSDNNAADAGDSSASQLTIAFLVLLSVVFI